MILKKTNLADPVKTRNLGLGPSLKTMVVLFKIYFLVELGIGLLFSKGKRVLNTQPYRGQIRLFSRTPCLLYTILYVVF